MLCRGNGELEMLKEAVATAHRTAIMVLHPSSFGFTQIHCANGKRSSKACSNGAITCTLTSVVTIWGCNAIAQ